MPCTRINGGFVCGPAGPFKYTYKGREWLFEDHSWFGPWPIRKSDGAPWGAGLCKVPKVFWEMYSEWNKLSSEEKAKTATTYNEHLIK